MLYCENYSVGGPTGIEHKLRMSNGLAANLVHLKLQMV